MNFRRELDKEYCGPSTVHCMNQILFDVNVTVLLLSHFAVHIFMLERPEKTCVMYFNVNQFTCLSVILVAEWRLCLNIQKQAQVMLQPSLTSGA